MNVSFGGPSRALSVSLSDAKASYQPKDLSYSVRPTIASAATELVPGVPFKFAFGHAEFSPNPEIAVSCLVRKDAGPLRRFRRARKRGRRSRSRFDPGAMAAVGRTTPERARIPGPGRDGARRGRALFPRRDARGFRFPRSEEGVRGALSEEPRGDPRSAQEASRSHPPAGSPLLRFDLLDRSFPIGGVPDPAPRALHAVHRRRGER